MLRETFGFILGCIGVGMMLVGSIFIIKGLYYKYKFKKLCKDRRNKNDNFRGSV